MVRFGKLIIVLLILAGCNSEEKQLITKFALVADIHVGDSLTNADLKNTVEDINTLDDVDFVALVGDITEMGSDKELTAAKEILDNLNIPWYVIPGNHDTKWSESGTNSFKRIFGYDRFVFRRNGYLFIGCSSGPNMRMGPGLVPREDIVWLDSLVHTAGETPLIFMNHYPLDEGLANWDQVIDLLKQTNVKVALCGHGHRNKTYDYYGIPGVMGRSNLTTKRDSSGYNLVTVTSDSIIFNEHITGSRTKAAWHKIAMSDINLHPENNELIRPSYEINDKYSDQVKKAWQIQDNSDIGAGIVLADETAVFTDTKGYIKALDYNTGEQLWEFGTKGKVYSTPAIEDGQVVVASTDGSVYNVSLDDGSLNWIFPTPKAIVASPVIDDSTVYVGSSEGIFRALSLNNGKILWEYDGVRGFVETKPLVDEHNVYFGDWGSYFYALDKKTGKLAWTWTNNRSRLYSPAACYPVKANGKIFIVAPDRYVTALDAKTGKEIWRSNQHKGRESIGLSEDGSLMYIKDMQDSIHAIYTKPDRYQPAWSVDCGFGYDIDPAAIVEKDGLVFVPTQWGTIYAVNRKEQKVKWAYKFSNAIVSNIFAGRENELLATSMDGKVIKLTF
jgi:outer membrane protein assembly factor BamB/predicted MPP superfamily phosphohydrolase